MAYLFITKGPVNGLEFNLDRARTVLGRHKDCDVVLDAGDNARRERDHVSRRHAIITKKGDRYFLEDGDGAGKQSRNGTYLNGALIPFPAKMPLTSHDVIRVCEFELIFHEGTEEFRLGSSVDAAISHDSSSSFLAQSADKLRLLLEITNHLGNTLELDKLLPEVVEILLTQLFKQADRCFLILADETTGELAARIVKTRREVDERFSVSVVRECMSKVRGLLINDVPLEFPDSESVAGLELRSLMCAPLWRQDGRAFGVLLLDSNNPKRKFNQDDLSLLMGVANQASIALTNARFHRDALARERLGRDLALAREVQRSFLPATMPVLPGYEFFARNESAHAVGGDYFDFVPLSGGRLGILLGDVAGKGVAAALVMARFSAEARTCLLSEPDLAAAIRRLNHLTQSLSLTDRFVTLTALVLDATAHVATVVNAGHPLPLVLRPGSGAFMEIPARADNGPPLGVVEGFPYVARTVTVAPGERLVLYSDGVTDAIDKAGHTFGMRGLLALGRDLGETPVQLGERVLRAVQAHAAGCAQQDDMTLICFGRTAAA